VQHTVNLPAYLYVCALRLLILQQISGNTGNW